MSPAALLEPPPKAEPRLAWVEIDGEMCHVSDFAHLAPGERPTARCPACREAITLKLGALRAHHAAHRPDSSCTAARGERAREINERFGRARRKKSEAESQDRVGPAPLLAAAPEVRTSVARALLLGYAGADAEVVRTPDGPAVRFPLATTARRTEWHRVVAIEEVGASAQRSVRKGVHLYVEGEITHRRFIGRDGALRWITEILATAILPV